MKPKKRDPLGPARRLAKFIDEIISSATASPKNRWKYSAVRCWRRPGHRKCPGHILVCDQSGGEIEWKCPACNCNGGISHWQGGWADLSDLRIEDESPGFEVVLPEQGYATFTPLKSKPASLQGIDLRAANLNDAEIKSAKMIGFMGNEEKFPCHFVYKIGDEFIYDGERFEGRVCPGLMRSVIADMMIIAISGYNHFERIMFRYHGEPSVRDASMKKYDGVGFRMAKDTPNPKMANFIPKPGGGVLVNVATP